LVERGQSCCCTKISTKKVQICSLATFAIHVIMYGLRACF
jgi:hypothetical protein